MFTIQKSFCVKNGNMDKIFSIITDFEKYPEFVPRLTHTSLRKITSTVWDSELRFTLFPFWITERNTAYIDGYRPDLKTVRTKGKKSLFFEDKQSMWKVQKVGDDVHIEFEATFQVKHPLLITILKGSIDLLSDSVVQAFVEREKSLP